MEQALSGPKKLYAVLNAPVYGTPVDDPFDILADEYFYIQYYGEEIKSSVYYPEDMGPQTYYEWQNNNDIREFMSAETYLYNGIPIDLTGCSVENPDTLSSADQVKLPENSKAFVSIDPTYYYPDGRGEKPNDMEANFGLKRYSVFLMKSGTSLTFMAWIGDNEISGQSPDPDDEGNVLAVVVQNGDMSDLVYIAESDNIGSIILLWLGVIFIITVFIVTSGYALEEEEDAPPPKKKKEKVKKKKRKRK